MRKKQKFKILLLFLLGILIYSCHYDDENINSKIPFKTNENFKLKKVFLKDYSKNTKLFNQIAKVESNRLRQIDNSTGKIVNSTDNSFSIDTEYATYIENENGQHSYTFKINRENPSYLLENLVLNSSDSLGYQTFIVSYDISQQEYDNIAQGILVDFSNKITISNLVDTNIVTNIFNKEDVVDIQTLCLTTSTVYGWCSYGLHNGDNMSECNVQHTMSQTTISSWEECTISINIGGGSTGGTGDGGGSGNPNSNPDSTYDGSDPNIHGNGSVSTAPTLDDNPPKKDPCDKVKDLLALNPNIKTSLLQLNNQTSNTTEEGSFLLNNSSTVQNATVSSSGEVQFTVPSNGVLIFMAHTHNSPSNSTYSVFSWEDLEGIAKFLKDGNIDATQFVTFLMTADGTRYAFTIDDTTSFLSFFAQIGDPLYSLENNIKKATTMFKYYGQNNGIENTIPNALIKVENTDLIKDEKNFLKIIKKNKIGITLFEVDSTFTNFEKVKLNFFNSITKNPCN
jgi:hypothetical protein